VEKLAPFLRDADLVLTMSVMPGFGGQSFAPAALEKIAYIRKHTAPNTLISVDGGINESTIADCARAGANLFVAGTAVFGTAEDTEPMQRLTQAAVRGFFSRGQGSGGKGR